MIEDFTNLINSRFELREKTLPNVIVKNLKVLGSAKYKTYK